MENGTRRIRIALTGFMGVGKSTVARNLGRLLATDWVDLDDEIELVEKKTVAKIVENDGIEYFRSLEKEVLGKIVQNHVYRIISLGGGAFTSESNRDLLARHKITSIWLGATFEHCWANISLSYKERPLARDRGEALRLFEERERAYCLADWHFLIQPGSNSRAVADQIAEQVFEIDVE
ncbi:MAG: hypothetical protein OEM82_08425 [Acidobacteriota bacterium]|nr:hypothetical protein [Acidobacteriota bacterium]MDH3529825.1 hypothetical protein [Acidobacteriota bacterium]